ncbi:MAG: hypothetical protein QW521_03285 [Desulfurococcaceae archaeon]
MSTMSALAARNYLALSLIPLVIATSACIVIYMDYRESVAKPYVIFKEDISLAVDKACCRKTTIDLGLLNMPSDGCIKAEVSDVRALGELSLVMSGALILKPVNKEDSTIQIEMPCMVSIGTNCFRIEKVIYGYDVPLMIKRGDYELTLILHWSAVESGKLSFKISIVCSEECSEMQ